MKSDAPCRSAVFRRSAMAALCLVIVHTAACAQTLPARTSPASERSAMPATTTRIDADGVAIEVAFDARPGAPVEVHYRLRNTGTAPLAVFDRGDRHAVLTGRQATGDIGAPGTREDGGGDVTLSHIARALPSPSPTLPPVPLAARVDAGAALEGHFRASPMTLDAPKRLRWCVGVVGFDPAAFGSPERVGEVEVWQASFDLADRQRLVCTPWFDLAAGGFV